VNSLSFEPIINLNANATADSESEKSAQLSMDGFLASVERRAYVIALAACHHQQTALDIVQDSMFNMVKYYGNKPSEQWPPLFFKVLNNRITDQHRKRGFGRLTRWFGNEPADNEQHNEAVDQLPSDDDAPDNLADSTQLRGAVEDAMSNLSFKQQQALVLRLWQGLSVKETATAMGISEGSVKTHLSRAVHEMREHLQEYKPS
jgi:RNA polymerase sigma-70 factor (ECF subfamily)